MSLVIDLSKCIICGDCISACPSNAISRSGQTVTIDESLCTLCKRCMDVCPVGAISEKILLEPTESVTDNQIQNNMEIVKSDMITTVEKTGKAGIGNLVIQVIPRLLDTVLKILDYKYQKKSGAVQKLSQNHTSQSGSKRHRHQYRGRTKSK